jgi:hypothetical protein
LSWDNAEPADGWILAAKMATNVGDWLYRGAAIIAVLIVLWDAADFFYGLSQGVPIIRIVGLSSAVVIWLIGRGCRRALSGH